MDEKQTGLAYNPVCGQEHWNDHNKHKNDETNEPLRSVLRFDNGEFNIFSVMIYVFN